MSILKFKRIQKETWAGRNRYPGTNFTIVAPLSSTTGNYKTGLTSEERSKIEEETGYNLKPTRENKFWSEFKVMFTEGEEKVIDTSDPIHQIELGIIKVSDKVAMSEAEKSKMPKAEFVLCDEEKDAKERNTARQILSKAWSVYNSLSPEEMRDMVAMLPITSVSNASNEVVQDKLASYVESSKVNQERFIALYEDPDKVTRILIEKLIKANILRKNGSVYYYGEDQLGSNLEETIAYLDSPKNSKVRKALKTTLQDTLY